MINYKTVKDCHRPLQEKIDQEAEEKTVMIENQI